MLSTAAVFALLGGGWLYLAMMLGILGAGQGIGIVGAPWCKALPKWHRGAVVLVWTLVTVGASVAVPFTFLVMGIQAMFLDDDHSADGWSVPDGMEVDLPERGSFGFGPPPDSVDDPFLAQLLAAPEDGTLPVADTRMPVLTRLSATPGEIERRLTRSPRWRVHEERGHRYATRLLPVRGRHHVTLNDFYSHGDFDHRASSFQVRLTIGLDGHARAGDHVSELPRSAAVAVPTEPGQNGQTKSWIAIRRGDIVVEVFEESGDAGRARTLAALAEVERELATPHTESAAAGPNDAATPGFLLRNGMQGGMYNMETWVDVDSPGTLHVRAFEVTTGTPLSARDIMERTQVRVHGEPGGPLQQARAEFTIYEGDWDHYYAARIELWFTPDGGEPRKLLERVYQVEGWMR